MSTIFDENLSLFLKRYPHLKSKIDDALRKDNKHKKDLVVKPKDQYLELWKSNQLIDSSAPHFFSLPQIPSRPINTVIIGGFGLGAWLQFIVNHHFKLSDIKKWIVIEPSLDEFLFSLSQSDFKNLFAIPQIEWFVGLRPEDFFSAQFHYLSNRENLIEAKNYALLKHPIIDALRPGYFDQWQKQWDASVELAKNTHSFFEDGFEGFRNTIKNRKWIARTPGINLLKDIFKDLPAIVISTGPSLKKSLPLLKQLQNKAILLAADASLKILQNENIHPHFVFCLERDEGSKPFFEGIPKENCKSNLMVFPLVPHTVINAYQGSHWTLYRNYEYYSFFEIAAPRGMIKCGPSVAHMATTTADIFGCSDIFLVGQDLSFDPDNLASHPEGISYSEWSKGTTLDDLKEKLKKANDQLLFVPGNLRDKVPTSGTYEIFRQVFVDHLKNLRAKIFNCTEGGAQIPGIAWKSLEEASRNFKEIEVWKKIEHARSQFLATDDIPLKSLEMALNGNIENDAALDSLLQHFLGKSQIEYEWKKSVATNAEISTEWLNEKQKIANKLRELL